eukprot:2030492-Amphidinium_carterae.1
MIGGLCSPGCIAMSRIISAKIMACVCSGHDGDHHRADKRTQQQQQHGRNEVSSAASCVSVRSGCLTLRQHVRVVCRARRAAQTGNVDRKARNALVCMRALHAQQWKRVVANRRLSSGLMLGERTVEQGATASVGEQPLHGQHGGEPEIAVSQEWSQRISGENVNAGHEAGHANSGALLDLPLRKFPAVGTRARSHCAGDGNCMWRALSKAVCKEAQRLSWKSLKKRVLRFAKKEYPCRIEEWRAMSVWGTPAGAVALQLAASALDISICLDWQQTAYCFGNSSREVWMRLYDHHFEPAVPRCGPVVDTSEKVADMGRCVGGASSCVRLRLRGRVHPSSCCTNSMSRKKQSQEYVSLVLLKAHVAWSGKKQTREESLDHLPLGAAPGRRNTRCGIIRKESRDHPSSPRVLGVSMRNEASAGRQSMKCAGLCVRELAGVCEGRCVVKAEAQCLPWRSLAIWLSCGKGLRDVFSCMASACVNDLPGSVWRRTRFSQPHVDGEKSAEVLGLDCPGLWCADAEVRGEDLCYCIGGGKRNRESRSLRGTSEEPTFEFQEPGQSCVRAASSKGANDGPTFEPALPSIMPVGMASSRTADTFVSARMYTESQGHVGDVSVSVSWGGGAEQPLEGNQRGSNCGTKRALSPTLPWPSQCGEGGGMDGSQQSSARCACGQQTLECSKCVFGSCRNNACAQCQTVIPGEYEDIVVCARCAHKVVDSPLVLLPCHDCEAAQQILVTVPVNVAGRWAWVRAGQHEPTVSIVQKICESLSVRDGVWLACGKQWQDNDVVQCFGISCVRGHGLVWRTTGFPGVGFAEKVTIAVDGNTSLPLYIPRSLSWSQVRKCVARHLAVAPEWIGVRLCESNICVQTTSAFPVLSRPSVSRMWQLVDGLRLRTVRRIGVGSISTVVAGVRATRARGTTRQSSVQRSGFAALIAHVRTMLPSAVFSACAVLRHGSIAAHCDTMNRKGVLSLTIASGSCDMWVEDPSGDHDLLCGKQWVRGRVHDVSRRWHAFNPLKFHAILTHNVVTTLVLYTPARRPDADVCEQLRVLGFPHNRQSTGSLSDMWGGGRKLRSVSQGQPTGRSDAAGDDSEYKQALVSLRTCRTGLTDPQLKFILRGTQGLASKVAHNVEPARAVQMVHAIARNLGMTIPKPMAGGQVGNGAKAKQKPKADGAGSTAAKRAQSLGTAERERERESKKDQEKEKDNVKDRGMAPRSLCDDEWSVPVGGEFNIKQDAVFLTQSAAQAKRWSDQAHNAKAAIGVVVPYPIQLGYREPTPVQFHLKNGEGQRTPAKGFLHHVTVAKVQCTADSAIIELPMLKLRSMLVMIDICKERIPEDTWASLTGSFDAMRTTIPTLLPAQARSGLIEVLRTAEWTDKSTTVMVRMSEPAVQASMRLLGTDGVTVRTPRELQAQFRILWPDRGESDTLAVCKSWAEKIQDHAGVFMKAGRFALRVPQKTLLEAKQACGQQTEERYILRGIPLDADASDVDTMLMAVGWAATANPSSRRVAQGTASFQIMAAHEPPKYGFHVKWGYLRCHVQVVPP